MIRVRTKFSNSKKSVIKSCFDVELSVKSNEFPKDSFKHELLVEKRAVRTSIKVSPVDTPSLEEDKIEDNNNKLAGK